jgi:hypothetical protein
VARNVGSCLGAKSGPQLMVSEKIGCLFCSHKAMNYSVTM